jgi:signal transduction histidine kinase
MNSEHAQEQLEELAAHLAARRGAIMQAWRTAVERDPAMTTGASLPRIQLNDHLPQLLDAFGAKLRALTGNAGRTHDSGHHAEAAAHGLQRWQQGYDLREVTREWGRLQLCMADELEAYAVAHPDLDSAVMPTARRAWIETCTDGVSDSTAQYFHLQQIEATGHVQDLEQALEQMQALEQQRAALWREAAHDLRGNLGVVVNVTEGLRLRSASEASRESFLRMLQRNVSSLRSLLEDVTDLARLQAGQEQRQVRPFDAAVALRDLCERMMPLAEERSLYLSFDGPSTLAVEGDAVKVQRIAQNLLLNAIKYTSAGGVVVSWGDSRTNDMHRWMLCVQDTGPGFHSGPGAPMAGALEDATEEARHVEHDVVGGHGNTADVTTESSPAGSTDSRPINQERGEGVGLSIVKRLCELLDATVEMESSPGEGTTVRILLPRAYGAEAATPTGTGTPGRGVRVDRV